MLANAFIGSTHQPTESELETALGSSLPVWHRLLERLAEELNLTTREWNSYSPKAGWSLRIKHKKRNIVYLSPRPGEFMVLFILGERALAALRNIRLPDHIRKAVDAGEKYPEGTGIRILMRGLRGVEAITKIAAVKMMN
jgi:hypothetical protein